MKGAEGSSQRRGDIGGRSEGRRRAEPSGGGYRWSEPDRPVALISPHDRHGAVVRQIAGGLARGTGMMVAVNPRWRSLAVQRSATDVRYLMSDDTLDGVEVVPGWTLPVRERVR